LAQEFQAPVEPASSDPKKKIKDEKALFTPLGQIDATDPPRIPSGDDGVNHVLGGGIVLGSVVLLFGWPGSGKSSLAITVAAHIANQFQVWYAIGEHGKERIRRMADRFKIQKRARQAMKNLTVLDEVSKDTDVLCKHLKERKPTPVLCVVDSLMSIQSEDCTGTPGSPSQVKYAALKLKEVAEDTGMAVVAIAHVTNDGSLAGPSHSKHYVDTLLMLDHVKLVVDKDDGSLTFKQIPKRVPGKPSFLRLAAYNKNRDGDVSACAYYKMAKTGLQLIGLADEDKLKWLEDPYKLLKGKSGEQDEPKAGTEASKRTRKAPGRNTTKSARGKAAKSRVLR
jgi:archaellum biogenesis ATPase FlaH